MHDHVLVFLFVLKLILYRNSLSPRILTKMNTVQHNRIKNCLFGSSSKLRREIRRGLVRGFERLNVVTGHLSKTSSILSNW